MVQRQVPCSGRNIHVDTLLFVECKWMEESMLKTVRICFPEQKNLYNKIFGGFLMRQAFELAWANGCVYSKNRLVRDTQIVDIVICRRLT